MSLNLNINKLKELPASLGRLRALETLQMTENFLSRLPDTFAELRALRKLWIDDNQFTELPRWVTELPHLEELRTHNNPWQLPPKSVMGGAGGNSYVQKVNWDREGMKTNMLDLTLYRPWVC